MRNATGRQKARYWFDNLMSKGTVSLLLLLGVITAIVAVAGGLMAVALGGPEGTGADSTGQSIWFTLMHAINTGVLAKEAVLGALAALFGSASGTMFATVSGAAAASFSPAVLATQVAAPEALAFLSALMFNIPCVMVVGATHSETHSTKWTVRISVFYFCLALCISCVVYHVAALIL